MDRRVGQVAEAGDGGGVGEAGVKHLPQYWPVIGRDRSRDLNTGLRLDSADLLVCFP